MRHNFWWHCDASEIDCGFQIAENHFFEGFDKAVILDVKNMNFCDLEGTTTFRCLAIPPKVMAHNTSSFLFLEFLKKRQNSLR